MILEGLKATLKNPGIIVFPILAMLVLYLLMSTAVMTAITPSELQNIAKNESFKNFTQQAKATEKVIYKYLRKNLTKTIIAFLMFGILAFVIGEFLNASMIVAAKEIVFNSTFSFKNAFDGGFVYTLPLIGVDILCGLGFLAFLMPFYIAYYVTGLKTIVDLMPIALLFVAPLLIMPRYILIVKDESVINSIVEGFRVAIRNYPLSFTAVVFCSLISMASLAVPIVYPIASAFSASLLSVYMCHIVGGE